MTATAHGVHGPHFGPVGGPAYATWSEAVLASLSEIAADLDTVGLDATDLRQVAEIAAVRRAVLDLMRHCDGTQGPHGGQESARMTVPAQQIRT